MVDTQAVLKGDGQFVHPWENIEELGNSWRTVLAGAEGVYLIDSEGRGISTGQQACGASMLDTAARRSQTPSLNRDKA